MVLPPPSPPWCHQRPLEACSIGCAALMRVFSVPSRAESPPKTTCHKVIVPCTHYTEAKVADCSIRTPAQPQSGPMQTMSTEINRPVCIALHLGHDEIIPTTPGYNVQILTTTRLFILLQFHSRDDVLLPADCDGSAWSPFTK